MNPVACHLALAQTIERGLTEALKSQPENPYEALATWFKDVPAAPASAAVPALLLAIAPAINVPSPPWRVAPAPVAGADSPPRPLAGLGLCHLPPGTRTRLALSLAVVLARLTVAMVSGALPSVRHTPSAGRRP